MAEESLVQVATDGAGKKVRTLSLSVVQPDGTLASVQMQVVAIVDQEGRAIDFGASETQRLLRALLNEMTALRKMYGRATSQGFVGLEGAMIDDTTG